MSTLRATLHYLPDMIGPQAYNGTGVRHFVELQSDSMLVLTGCKRPDAVRCLAGRLWITQEGDVRDHVLFAGKMWSPLASHSGCIVITALDDACLELFPV